MRGKVSEQRGESWSKADDENSPTTKASFQKEWPFVHQSGETSTTTSTTTTATVAGPTTTTTDRGPCGSSQQNDKAAPTVRSAYIA